MKNEIVVNRFNFTLDVTVRLGKEGRLRKWLAGQLIQWAALVLGGKSDLDIKE